MSDRKKDKGIVLKQFKGHYRNNEMQGIIFAWTLDQKKYKEQFGNHL